jgi:hypothetical protein
MPTDLIEYTSGTKRYYRDGVLHRDNDLPAVEYDNGSREWWVHGKRLRWDPRSPTEILCDPTNYNVAGTRIWHSLDSKKHRDDDNPAVIHADGTKEWWFNGQRYRGNGLPTIETGDGQKLWHNRSGKLHRRGLPAVIGPNGSPEWWFNGLRQSEFE